MPWTEIGCATLKSSWQAGVESSHSGGRSWQVGPRFSCRIVSRGRPLGLVNIGKIRSIESNYDGSIIRINTGWWFGTFFIFPYIGNNHPNWRTIFFRGVETTNQLFSLPEGNARGILKLRAPGEHPEVNPFLAQHLPCEAQRRCCCCSRPKKKEKRRGKWNPTQIVLNNL